MVGTIDIGAEIERIERDLDDAEMAGIPRVTFSFFGGQAEEKKLLIAAVATIKKRGYDYELEYEDGEIYLVCKREA